VNVTSFWFWAAPITKTAIRSHLPDQSIGRRGHPRRAPLTNTQTVARPHDPRHPFISPQRAPGPGAAGKQSSPSAERTVPAALPASRPTRLDILSIGVHTSLLDLGLAADGTLQTPSKPLQAGWFHGSPTPGQAGPAVILGHVDSCATGPAVFYRPCALKPRQSIRVTRLDHTVAVFTVDAVRTFPKKTFPTLDVYGNTPDPELRLITCSDWNSHPHAYDGNTIVYAHLTR